MLGPADPGREFQAAGLSAVSSSRPRRSNDNGLAEAGTFLRQGTTFEDLHVLARALTNVQAAEELNEAHNALFRRVLSRFAPAVDKPAAHTTRAWTAPC